MFIGVEVASLRRLQAEVSSSLYRTRRPQEVRLEKSYGINRRVYIPAPEDAVLLQTLSEHITPALLSKRPTSNAFYSRAHGTPPSPSRIDATFSYNWWTLWPEMQQRIFNFTEDCPFVVVTDISNYFDNVSLRQLRNVLSSMADFSETVLDFLFFMLEEFVWRPDYLPSNGVGLPQLNFDAPNILAHAFLFEIDRLLSQEVGGNFVRWMDDITFGVSSPDQARKILGRIDDLLHARGIRLNQGKTHILNAKDASDHFFIEENRSLTVIKGGLDLELSSPPMLKLRKSILRKRFTKFWRLRQIGNWDKVLLRYIGLFEKTRDTFFLKYCEECLYAYSKTRPAIFRYYISLNYNLLRFEHIRSYILETCTDDASLFQACNVLIDWNMPTTQRARIIDLTAKIAETGTYSGTAGSIWLLAKYGTREEIVEFLRKTAEIWRNNSFCARQVAAITPRLSRASPSMTWIIDTLTDSGQLEGLRVLANLRALRSVDTLPRADMEYLIPREKDRTYPLPKVLMAIDVLGGRLKASDRDRLRAMVNKHVTDSWYRKLLGV
jgi:hypothetical protein